MNDRYVCVSCDMEFYIPDYENPEFIDGEIACPKCYIKFEKDFEDGLI